MTTELPPLASGYLDRDAASRMNADRLESAWREPGARVLRVRGVEVPVRAAGDGLEIAWVRPAGAYTPVLAGGAVGQVYLGRDEQGPLFAIEEPAESVTDTSPGTDTDTGAAAEWRHPFEIGLQLDPASREAVGEALAVFNWHRSERVSPATGERTSPTYAGWARLDEHGAEHFPRTDPAVIVVIEHEDRILLGSNALWESGRFSLLAGFVEAGESLETTVLREVYEEAGVRVAEPRYVASQPWPFPRSLMFGLRARLADGVDPDALRPDPSEISELRWFTREELRNPAPGIILPMGMSIASWLIDLWIDRDPRVTADASRG